MKNNVLFSCSEKLFPACDVLSKRPHATKSFLKHTEKERKKTTSRNIILEGLGKFISWSFESHDSSETLSFYLLSNSCKFVNVEAINIISRPHTPIKQCTDYFFPQEQIKCMNLFLFLASRNKINYMNTYK